MKVSEIVTERYKHGDYARGGGPMPKAKKGRTKHPLHGKFVGEEEIDEAPVISSWISDLTLVKGASGNVTMALGNGNRYSVKSVGGQLFNAWLQSPSKGKFWHKNIKNKFQVVRLL
jgi:hypothetical protein